MPFEDILGLGKILPLDKLLDVVQNGLGKVTKSYFDRRDVDTEVYRLRKLAQVKAELEDTPPKAPVIQTKISSNLDDLSLRENKSAVQLAISGKTNTISITSLDSRISNRKLYQEAIEQLNIEQITSFAAEELREEKEVTDAPINQDWTTRFFKLAADISDVEMQILWGKILAGEVKQPQSYSLRALELVKNLSANDAKVFRHFASYSIISSGSAFILDFDSDKSISQDYDLLYADKLLLEELGLMSVRTSAFSTFNVKQIDCHEEFLLGDKVIYARATKKVQKQTIKIIPFTRLGKELLKLIDFTPDPRYIQLLVSKVKQEGLDIKLGTFVEKLSNGRNSYNIIQQF